MQKNLKNKQSAFTLLELLIVMIILALLSGLGLMAFGTIQQKSRDSRRKQDLSSISKALETYYNDNEAYPSSSVGVIEGCGVGASEACTWGEVWETDDGALYMTALPQDPVTSQNYYYYQVDDNSYYLFAHLENELDSDAAVDGDGDPSFYSGVYSCGTAGLGCNYIIMSTNLVSKPAVI
jgi:prepilin-type N-terminal cleavage/methylation domain-containing protein